MKTLVWIASLLILLGVAQAASITNCTTITSSNTQYYVSTDLIAVDNANCIVLSGGALNNSFDCLGNTISVRNATAIGSGTSAIHQVKNCKFVSRTVGKGTAIFAVYGAVQEPSFRYNTFYGFEDAIYFQVSAGSGNFGEIFSNTFINNTIAIGLSTTRPLSIYDNYILNNTYVISFTGFGGGGSIAYNNFLSGLNQITGTGIVYWNTTRQTKDNIVGTNSYGGNFWTNPTNTDYSNACDDANADGYCDEPLSIITNNIDNLPISITGVTIAEVVTNNPPAPFVEFMGTDTGKNNFIFRTSLQDVEGGNAYVAYNLLNFGEGGTVGIANSSVFNDVNFRKASDLSSFTNDYCSEFVNITAAPPGQLFGADGMLRLDMSTCTYPTVMKVGPYATTDISGLLSNQIIFRMNTSLPAGGYNTAGFDFRAKDGSLLGTILFYTEFAQTNITFFNGVNETLLYNSSLLSEDEYILETTFDFLNQKMNISVRGLSTPSTFWIHNVQKSYVHSAADLSEIDLTAYYVEDVDSISFSYNKIVTYPLYQFFYTLNPGQRHSEDLRVPIGNRTFAKYELFLWATDTENGLSAYGDSAYASFQYSAQTPALTDAQIAEAIEAKNTRDEIGKISGDLFTDTIPSYLAGLGFASVGSKMFASLIIIILVAWLLVTAGAAVTIIGIIFTIFALTYIGFIPAWVTAVIVIIAATLGAMALRKAYIGA